MDLGRIKNLLSEYLVSTKQQSFENKNNTFIYKVHFKYMTSPHEVVICIRDVSLDTSVNRLLFLKKVRELNLERIKANIFHYSESRSKTTTLSL